ncbi:hypothetical protein INT45_008595 [Circinella minor]|uniref:Uncharacterized protein n=1 Tax=Circinella minor TaxID=1195481 RepID=A0A8H7RXS2_9FUNG|nr:hypothetical protein INT45_008595 [Circinella minor]
MVEYNTSHNNNINHNNNNQIPKKSTTLQRLARWQTSNTLEKKQNSKPKSLSTLEPVHHDDLTKGSLYIVKINHVSITLFEGWDDEMCCFSILRSEAVPLRWSEARFLPGDFESFDAFDNAGNPPVHLWTRYLQVEVPANWFALFEEARRKQRAYQVIQLRGSQLPSLPTCSPLPHHHHQQQQQQQEQQILTDDHQRLIRDYALQSSSIPVTSSAAASTNIVDPTSSFLSSVSSLPIDSRPLGYIMNYNDSSEINPGGFNNTNNTNENNNNHSIEFPLPPSSIPTTITGTTTTTVLDREELRRHLQDDLVNLQEGSSSLFPSSSHNNNQEDKKERRPSSMSLFLETDHNDNHIKNNNTNKKNGFLRHHASFTLSNKKRQSIQNFFSKK